MTDVGSLPPHSRDAERGLLGACLRDNRLILEAAALVPEDFYVYAHQKAWEAMLNLHVHSGKPVEPVGVAEWLRAKRLLDEIKPEYIVELWDAAPSFGAERFAEIIKAHAIRRDLIHAGFDIAGRARDDADATGCLEAAQQQIFAIADRGTKGQAVPLSVVIPESIARVEARASGAVAGILSGWPDLDNITGGFHDSELVVLAARPSVGKTAFALNVARRVAKDSKAVLFVSLEQSRQELGERLIAMESEIDAYLLRTGKMGIDFPIANAQDALEPLPLFIDDRPNQTMFTIAAEARRLRLRNNLQLVIVDYLQLISAGSDERKLQREQQVAGVSRRLKFLAKELRVPVIALSQLNRSSEDRRDKRPRLSDLRESGAIEQDADTVLLLHKETSDNSTTTDMEELEVLVEKQRNGPIGTALLGFHKATVRVVSL